MKRINILGGGVVGLSTAVALASAGHSVTVIDDDVTRKAASWGNAGHIATEQVEPLASLATLRGAWGRRFAAGGAMDLPPAMAGTWLPFAARFVMASGPARFANGRAALGWLLQQALPAWRRLAASIDAPELLRESGHLVLWEGDHASARRAAWERAETGTASIHDATADDLARVAALTTAKISGAIRFAGSAQIADLRQLADRLEATLQAKGGRIVREAAAIEVHGGVVNVPGHDADLILIAAGARSASLIRAAGHHVPLIAERGYHIRAAADRWPADMPPLVFEDRSMIVTRYADQVQAASFVEFATPDAPPDPRKWERLERHVRELGLPMEAPFARWMGARPTLPDYLPAIGRSKRAGNLLYAFGHQHLGLTLAPVTADLVAGMVAGEAPPPAFDLTRFGGKA